MSNLHLSHFYFLGAKIQIFEPKLDKGFLMPGLEDYSPVASMGMSNGTSV